MERSHLSLEFELKWHRCFAEYYFDEFNSPAFHRQREDSQESFNYHRSEVARLEQQLSSLELQSH